ncbi:ferric reductase [Rhodobacteraceae bacterium KN286]|uniref:Ferric reductase n=1 Tax=Oceanomicrobium pacificus TaxID=2692916 RepID=A0A6B0TTW3_9RHOB|nr:ferric reductase [Oceanomicrobium pacificus]
MRAGRVAGLGLLLLLTVPILIAAASPLQSYRSIAYVSGSLAGVTALMLLIAQPLLAGGLWPGLTRAATRRWHRRAGGVLAASVLVHVGGLTIASPADAIDALMLVSPTPFSIYGVTAMWVTVLTVLLVVLRRRLPVRPVTWAWLHNGLALLLVGATVVHAMMIEGTMGPVSKGLACAAALVAGTGIIAYLRVWRTLRHRA